tara:strand:- start:4048 stop:7698 length:3651 start_codon:yes stop_codon:yes gene_type:complete
MALTRGDKKVQLPISQDFSRMGKQPRGTDFFGAALDVVQPLAELEAHKQDLELEQLQLSSTEKITNYKYQLDKDRFNRKTLETLSAAQKKEAERIAKEKLKKQQAIEDANNKNYVHSMKAIINLDINSKIEQLALKHIADPAALAEEWEAWKKGYTSGKEFPKQLKDRDGVLIGDFLLEFETKSSAAFLPNYVSAAKEARKIHSAESWGKQTESWESGLSNAVQLINQLGDGLNIPTDEVDVMLQGLWGTEEFDKEHLSKRAVAGDIIGQMELVMGPLYKQFEEYQASLLNLTQMYPDIYNETDVLAELNKQRTTLDSHILGAFAKFIISGDPANREAEKATAMEFINDWWNGEFANSKTGIGAALNAWTSDEHSQAERDQIRSFAESQVNAKYNRSKLGWSQVIDQKNLTNSLKTAMWESDGLGSFNDMSASFIAPSRDEIEFSYTKFNGDGTSDPNPVKVEQAINKLALRDQLIDDFDALRENKFSWHDIVGRNQEFGTEQDIVDAFYFNTLQAEISGSEIIERMSTAVESGRAFNVDPVLNNFQLAFQKTRQYPTNFIKTVQAMGKVNAESADQVNKFKGLITLSNTLGFGVGLDGDTYMALKDAAEVLETGNLTDAIDRFNRYFEPNELEEDKIIDMIATWDADNQWLDSRIAEINDHITDQKDWVWSMEAWKKILLPKSLESWKYELTNENIQKFGEEQATWWTWTASTIRDALDNNKDVLNTMIRNEMETMLMRRDKGGIFDQEGMEQLAEAATYNVYSRLNSGDMQFENYMFDPHKFNQRGVVLTDNGIQKHTGWNNETLRANVIIETMAMTNAMDFEAAEDFWGTADYGEKLDNLNTLFEEGGIRFKFDERSRFTDTPQWHIMIDVSGEGDWKELRNPENYGYSWSPTGNLLTNTNQASVESIKRKIVADNTMEQLSSLYQTRITDDGTKELWTYIGKSRGTAGFAGKMDKDGWVKVESGKIGENDHQMISAINGFIATIGNNIERFKDVFSDWEDIDTWVEIATKNQKKVALEINKKKNEIENPQPLLAKTKFKSVAQAFDVPFQNRVGDNFYVYEQKYIDNLKNINSYKAIGPNLQLDEAGINKLKSMDYTDSDIEKLMNGEIGIPVHHYDQLLDEKYDLATTQYDDLYGDVIITPLQREVMVDLIANLGLEHAGLDSPIYNYIQEGNTYGVYNELKRLEPFYVNKARHAYHVNMWGATSKGKYNF